jgi:antitoxin component YwqK of YwqJK toxin-antitoxin module
MILLCVFAALVLSLGCQRTKQSQVKDELDLELDCPPNTKRVEKLDLAQPEIFCIGENGKQGPWKEFSKDMKLRVLATFVDDKLQGPWTMFSVTGKAELQGQYHDGKRTGRWLEWYVDGNKRSEKEYVDGLEHGYTKVWYRNGELMAEGQYVNSLEEGPWKVYNPQGKLARECVMVQGEETDCVVHDKEFQISSRKNESKIVIK